MCELMGLSFERPVSADLSIRSFSARGEENADGWGLAWYPDRAAALVKEPIKWGSSRFARFLEDYPALRSPIYIAHVRYKTVGGAPSYADTHPFCRERDGREYCMAHNGTLEGAFWDLPTGRYCPLGVTDSERAFCHVLGQLDRRGGHLDTPDDWDWLHGLLNGMNAFGYLNVILSDGHRLFCYHDLTAWKGLAFRGFASGGRQIRHVGDETLDLELTGPAPNRGYVVASCPLDVQPWHRFRTGELLVLEKGVARYSSHRPVDNLDRPPEMPLL